MRWEISKQRRDRQDAQMSSVGDTPKPPPRWRGMIAWFAAPLAAMVLIFLLLLLGAMDEDQVEWPAIAAGMAAVYLLILGSWSLWMAATSFLLRRLGAAWEARWVFASTGLYAAAMAALVFISDSDFREDAGFGVFMVIFVFLMNLAMAAAFKVIAALPWRVLSVQTVEDVFN